MTVSVIIPTYNRKELVQRAINSVLRQTHLPKEIIVIDDGSTDGTEGALNAYGRKIIYVYQDNAGVSAARNRGIEKATGEVLAFLDSDDEWLPTFIETLTPMLARRPEAVAVAANGIIRTTGPDRDILSQRTARIRFDGNAALVSGVLAVLLQPMTSGILIRRQALDKVGWFDPLIRSEFEDMDLWSRLAVHGSWIFSREPLWVHYRDTLDQTNLSQQCWQQPLSAYQNLLHSHERLFAIPRRGLIETFMLRRAVGNYRCLVGTLMLDKRLPAGWMHLMRSLVDWPTLWRSMRVAAILAGWRPLEIRKYSAEFRAARRSRFRLQAFSR